ncbi:hypothetical protein G9444_6832 (plasmid) [Rhodococcus erythropolis]|uniref:Uncharacterized protein n=1 Tax=Rhodococcus erythropolis TaxID=1833 RepID=A0A6G9D460_RHOER|nr:hypothetical protein G9444_6832 [Rhodococcus erythropolis]
MSTPANGAKTANLDRASSHCSSDAVSTPLSTMLILSASTTRLRSMASSAAAECTALLNTECQKTTARKAEIAGHRAVDF